MGIVRTVQKRCSTLTLGGERPIPAALGLAFFYAWNFASYFSEAVVADAGALPAGRMELGIPISFARMATFALIALLAGRLGHLCEKPRAGAAVACLGGVGAAAMAFSASGQGTGMSAAFALGMAASGVATAWALVVWGEAYSCLEGEGASAYVLASAGLGYALYLALSLLPPVLRAVVSCFLVPFCIMSAYAAHAGMDEVLPAPKEGSAGRYWSSIWRVLAAVYAFGVVFWLMYQVAYPSLGDSALNVNGSALLAFGLIAAIIASRHRFSFQIVYRLVLPLMTASFLIAQFSQEGSPLLSSLSGVLSMTAFTALDLAAYAAMAQASHRTGYSPTRAFALGRLVETSVVPSSYAAYLALGGAGQGTLQNPVFLMSVCVVLVLVSGLALSGQAAPDGAGSSEAAGAPAPGPMSAEVFARQCEEAARRYGLSEREEQVMLLVTRGRNIPHIAKRMHLSSSTVKTHVRHIYDKMGVDDRQAMLDLIEGIGLDGE